MSYKYSSPTNQVDQTYNGVEAVDLLRAFWVDGLVSAIRVVSRHSKAVLFNDDIFEKLPFH